MQTLTIVAALVALVGFAFLSLLNAARSSHPWKTKASEPPGPALVPWIGRIHDLPIQLMWLKFKEWADQYGPIYRTKMLGANFIIISDEKIAEDLLVKRAKVFSDRPEMKSLFDSKSTTGTMEYLPLMGKNEYWARQRKFTHSYLTEATNARYYGIMNHETKRWLKRLLDDPDNFGFQLENMASKVMCQLTWDDDSLSEAMTPSAWGLLTQMSPAGPITNVITPLWDYLPEPINPWKRTERKRHDAQQQWWMDNLVNVRTELAKGLARPSFTRTYLEGLQNGKTGGLSGDYEASSAIGMMALVGVFTVAGPLYYFLLAMVYHPEWQRKCQREIDEVCKGQMPDISDMPNLPILRACIKETMRWRPNVPTGVAHEAEADDFYEGWLIPKGSRILPLDYAFMRNAEKYPDPEAYRPERWLEAGWPTFKEPLTQYPTIMGMSSFGYGQRQCLGQSVTRDETLVACGGLLWGFNLKKKLDSNGIEISPPLDKSNSLLIVKPDPFEMAFEPRSDSRRDEILQNWKKTDLEDRTARAAFIAKATESEKASAVPCRVDSMDPANDYFKVQHATVAATA
ncbi:Cytochrome P450 monooxygenase [Pseudocercospora fuligena]|uniref:Cytochrome P450 monooxygenase n=1 Tax=Pseudocercospora fuligena TaxID=685502 RepID=A0A8H6R7T1_9PEZI|nr:Cytochrome P450 monooxygenase [Pseudocercospora fuligena]